jgi:hypothetical protein
MTSNVEALLPGTEVLFDTDTAWASQPLRGRRGVVVRRIDAAIGDSTEWVVCVGPCDRSRHDDSCFSAIAFRSDELLLVPDEAAS